MTSVFLHFFNLSVIAGWMVLAVLLLRLCLKKAPRWVTCVLWGLVALRLLMPFTIESPVSLIPTAQTVVSTEDTDSTAPVVNSGMTAIDKPLNDWLQTPVKPQGTPPVQSPLPPVSDTTPGASEGDADVTPQPPVEDTPTVPEEKPVDTEAKSVSRMERILQIAAPVWMIGIGLMLAYELVSVLRVRRRVWDAVLLRDNVWQSDRVSSPFIFGLFRPRIYVPYDLEESMLEQVLSHERSHLHRRDHWIKPFAFTLLAVYWYNPLLWVGYILLCRDIEVACDERVVRGLDEDSRRQYATALLQCGVERRSIAACPLAFGEVSIKQRIKSVLNYRKPLLWVIIVSLVACSVAAVCLLTVPSEGSTKVLSSEEIQPDQVRQFFSQDTDGSLVESGRNWMWEHAENRDAKTPDVKYWEETNIPLVVSHSKADLDALMDACSDEALQVDMRYWFDLEKYDDAFFEDKVLVWLHVPGYDIGYYDYTVTLEETNKGLRYAVSLDYESTSMFQVRGYNCEYLLLLETDRNLVEEAKSLTTRHEQAPYTLPEGLTMVPVGRADMDGDGEKEDIRIYHSALDWFNGWDSGYETAYLMVFKQDGTPILRERTLISEHSQCYLVPQEGGTCLLLLLEAGDVEYAYSEEEFGVLSLKDGVRTVLDDKYESMHPTGWLGISFGTLAPYARTLSDWLENAQLLYECDNGTIRYGVDVTAQYQPLCWLDEYRNSDDDTLQDILENILASLGGETVSCGELDFDGDGDNEQLSVVRYVDEDGIYQHSVLVVRNTDGSILTAAQIHYDYVDETRGFGSYVYRVKTADGVVLKLVSEGVLSDDFYVYDVTIHGKVYNTNMTMAEWLEYRDAHDGELLFYFEGLEMHLATTTDSMAKVQYQALLKNVYQEQSDTYYTLYDVDGDDTQELLVKVGETIVINTARNDWTLPDESDIDWVSFKEEPVHMVDMTSDGFQDVAVCVDNVYGKIFAVLRWDTEEERLVMMPTTLQNPAVDMQKSIIRTSRSGDQIVSHSMWRYDAEKQDFVRTHDLYFHRNEQSTGDDDSMKLVVTENGQTKTLYVRGEPYALDKTDPQVAPYYEPGSFWDLEGLQWEAMQWDVQDRYGNYAGYAGLLKGEYGNQEIVYAYHDLDADVHSELLVLEGLTLSVYTMKDNFTHLLVKQDFASGTSRFLTTGDSAYPGLIYFCVGGGKDRYYYLSLDKMENQQFVLTELWTDNYAYAEEGEDGRITELSDDKRLIELSRQAYQNNRDLVFSQFGGTTTTTTSAQPMVRITYSTSENATLQELQKSCDILEQRLTAMGMFGYRISITEDETILLEVPRSYYPGNLNKRAYIWGSQGELAICVGDTADGIVPMPPEDTVLDYRHVASAKAVAAQDGKYAVALTFTAEGADLLADITTELAKTKDYLYVHMDWEFYDTLQVLQPITDGECVVDGFASWEAAALFAAKLNAGILPYNYAADVDFSLVE